MDVICRAEATRVQAAAFFGRAFFPLDVTETSPSPMANGLPLPKDSNGGLTMRVFIICAIVITAAVGVTGCFHHQKAVTQEPLKLG
jgi:hypothetical protein